MNGFPLCYNHWNAHDGGDRIENKIGVPVIRRKVIPKVTIRGMKTSVFEGVVKMSDVYRDGIVPNPVFGKYAPNSIVEEDSAGNVIAVQGGEISSPTAEPSKHEVVENQPQLEDDFETELERKLESTKFELVEED